ncbi:Chaperone protein ClpB [compost metagenome]
MTSNIGSPLIQELATQGPEVTRKAVMDELRSHFRPEFLNRVDDVLMFHSLSLDEIKRIVDIQLEKLRQRLAERKIGLELTEAAKEAIAREGFDPIYGARPLKRAIQNEILNPLSLKLLEGAFHDGDRIRIDAVDGALRFEKEAPQPV